MTWYPSFKKLGTSKITRSRRGATATLIAVLMIPIIGIVSFAIDYGYLLSVRSDMQRTADAAALAACQDLVTSIYASENILTAKATVRKYVRANLGFSFQVLDSDIEIGKYDPETIYENVKIHDQLPYDTIRVTLRRDGSTNGPVSLFFAPAMGIFSADLAVTATAVLRRSNQITPGADILPFAIHIKHWDSLIKNDSTILYGNGKIVSESGIEIPGNWGTVDIGLTNNSTADIIDQILNGLRQVDIDALYETNRIFSQDRITSGERIWLSADTGLSIGLKSAIISTHGKSKIIPIYDMLNEPSVGENLQYRIIAWGAIKVLNSEWRGEKNSYIVIQKKDMYVGSLKPKDDLTTSGEPFEGAFTNPALV